MTTVAGVAEARRARVQEWEAVHQVVPWGAVPDRNFEKFVERTWAVWMDELEERHPPKPAAFLDLGCGAGANAIWLAGTYGHRVVAVDASQAACDRLLERVSRQEDWDAISKRLVAMSQDLATIPVAYFPDAMFDCAFDVCCLQHMTEDDAVAVVQKTRRWLKPGGWFWSKQALPPFDESLNRTSYIRTASMDSLRRMFRGYSQVKIDLLLEVVRGDKQLHSAVVTARVNV